MATEASGGGRSWRRTTTPPSHAIATNRAREPERSESLPYACAPTHDRLRDRRVPECEEKGHAVDGGDGRYLNEREVCVLGIPEKRPGLFEDSSTKQLGCHPRCRDREGGERRAPGADETGGTSAEETERRAPEHGGICQKSQLADEEGKLQEPRHGLRKPAPGHGVHAGDPVCGTVEKGPGAWPSGNHDEQRNEGEPREPAVISGREGEAVEKGASSRRGQRNQRGGKPRAPGSLRWVARRRRGACARPDSSPGVEGWRGLPIFRHAATLRVPSGPGLSRRRGACCARPGLQSGSGGLEGFTHPSARCYPQVPPVQGSP